jgi:hypothetical protein
MIYRALIDLNQAWNFTKQSWVGHLNLSANFVNALGNC